MGVIQDRRCLSSLGLVIPQEEVASLWLGKLTGEDCVKQISELGFLEPHGYSWYLQKALAGGLHTPSTMILAAILRLEVLGWQAWVTVAMPYRIAEQSLQWGFRDASKGASASPRAFASASKHGDGCGEMACCQSGNDG